MPDLKITQLNADTAPTADDLIITVTDPGGSPLNKKVTVADLFLNAQPISLSKTFSDQYSTGITIDIYSTYVGSSSYITGLYANAALDRAGDFGTVYGLYFYTVTLNNDTPQKTISAMRGITGTTGVAGDYTTVGNLYGSFYQAFATYAMTSVNIGTMVGASCGIFLGSGDISVTEAKSLEINSSKAGTVTGTLGTIYGIYIPDHSLMGFTTHYNIYSVGTSSRNLIQGYLFQQGCAVFGSATLDDVCGIKGEFSKSTYFTLTGIKYTAISTQSGEQTQLFAADFIASMQGTGQVLEQVGVRASATVTTNCIANSMAIDVWPLRVLADGITPVVNSFGIKINTPYDQSGTASWSTHYGLYIISQKFQPHIGVNGCYNFYSQGLTSENAFEGEVQFFKTTGTNYERSYLKWVGNTFTIGLQQGGSGVLRHIDMECMGQLEFIRDSDHTPTGWVYTQGKWMQMECYPDTGQGCVGVNGDYFGIFTGNFITIDESASKVIGIQGLATAPTTQPTHLVQLWVADWGGDARLHILSETGDAIAIGNNRIWGMTTFTIGNADGNLTVDASMSLILEASDGDVYLNPIGGNVKFGTYTGLGAETLAGYITIKDAAGNTRKLAVVA